MEDKINLMAECILKKIMFNEYSEPLFYEFTTECLKQMDRIVFTKELESLYDFTDSFCKIKDMTQPVEKIYQVAQLYGMLDFLKRIVEKEKLLNTFEYAKRYKSRYKVFEGIHKNAGISHKELADYASLSPSGLSQFINTIQTDHVIVFRNLGRQKYYYLTQFGNKVLMEMQKMYEKELPILNPGKESFKQIVDKINNDVYSSVEMIPKTSKLDFNNIYSESYFENDLKKTNIKNSEGEYAKC